MYARIARMYRKWVVEIYNCNPSPNLQILNVYNTKTGVSQKSFRCSSGEFIGTFLLLYILYINDMFDSLTVAKLFNFADDTKLLMEVHTPEDHSLQHDLYNQNTWKNS